MNFYNLLQATADRCRSLRQPLLAASMPAHMRACLLLLLTGCASGYWSQTTTNPLAQWKSQREGTPTALAPVSADHAPAVSDIVVPVTVPEPTVALTVGPGLRAESAAIASGGDYVDVIVSYLPDRPHKRVTIECSASQGDHVVDVVTTAVRDAQPGERQAVKTMVKHAPTTSVACRVAAAQ